MKIKQLLITAFCFVPLLALAKTPDGNNDNASEDAPSLTRMPSPLPGYNGYSSRTDKNLSSTLQLGFTHNTLAANGASATGGGLAFQYQLGITFQGGGGSKDRTRALSVELCYSTFSAKAKITDKTTAITSDTKFTLNYVGLPVTYTGLSLGESGSGFYFQIGVMPAYNIGSSQGGNPAKNVNSIIIVPSASAGISLRFVQRSGRGKGGNLMIGPYASYSATNESSATGINLRTLTYGLRITQVRID